MATHAAPLRPIRDDEGHRRAIEILDRMIDLGPGRTSEEEDYLVVLGLLVEHYEDAIDERPGRTSAAHLGRLMEDNGLTASELSEETGISVRTLSDIVNGRRKISPKVRKTLADHFGMPPSHFL